MVLRGRTTGAALRVLGLVLVAAALARRVGAGADPALPHDDAASIYRDLVQAQAFPDEAVSLADVTLARGPVRIHVDRARAVPVRAGAWLLGLLLEGEGRLRVAPAEAFERARLVRLADAPAVDLPFTRLYLLASGDEPGEMARSGSGRATARDAQALATWLGDRLLLHLTRRGENVRARLLADRVDGGSGYLFAEADVGAAGVITVEVDPLRAEPVQAGRFVERFGGMFDVWSAPWAGGPPEDPAAIAHHDLDVRVDGAAPVRIRDAATLACAGARRVLRFVLDPRMRVLGVTRAVEPTVPLLLVREPRGPQAYERHATVVLPPASPGAPPPTLVFELEGDVVRDAGAGQFGLVAHEGLYPSGRGRSRATFALTIDAPREDQVFASARLTRRVTQGDRSVTSWEQPVPVPVVGFDFGRMRREDISLPGHPAVTVFGLDEGVVLGDQLRWVGTDVARASAWLEWLLGPQPFGPLTVTSTPDAHGQGLPGLVELPAPAFAHTGSLALAQFLGHEVSHQWWGQLTGFRSDRDLWLSEGFAEYTGALFAAHAADDAATALHRMLAAWRLDILSGSAPGTRGPGKDESQEIETLRVPAALRERSLGTSAGPVGLGRAIVSSRAPVDLWVVVYRKGAWVLHMLRVLLDGPDLAAPAPRFARFLRDVVASGSVHPLDTDAVRVLAERVAGEPLGWFFDAWVRGTAVPRYRWAASHTRSGGRGVLRLRVRAAVAAGDPAERVPRARVPIRMHFAGAPPRVVTLDVDSPERVYDIEAGEDPESIEFNAGDAVLCEARRERW